MNDLSLVEKKDGLYRIADPVLEYALSKKV
jgi:hypothetical protein